MRVAGYVGGLGNVGLRLVRGADAVLDVSGGDSFSDIYGAKRLQAVSLPKRITYQQGKPLILLPQTYGPFSQRTAGRSAAAIVAKATMAWARDADSFRSLCALLAGAFDPARHRSGVDMAFALEPRQPKGADAQTVRRWLAEDRSVPTVGLNVSGLLYNDARASSQYGLRADYRKTIVALLRRLLRDSNARVLLIPHVAGETGESDRVACVAVREVLLPEDKSRVTIASHHFDAAEMKWVIAQADWFCGTRMHSTIAALSTGVPAAAIAYSVKTRGVFETCGQERQVADARQLDGDGVLALLWTSWCDREAQRAELQLKLPGTMRSAESQMDTIVSTVWHQHRLFGNKQGRFPRSLEKP